MIIKGMIVGKKGTQKKVWTIYQVFTGVKTVEVMSKNSGFELKGQCEFDVSEPEVKTYFERKK